MEEELAELKSVLRSLVVSSPTRVDARSVLQDYRNTCGRPLPHAKFGYRDPLAFLRERCNDCFLFQGPSSNPELTLIVPKNLKHVDKFVQKQKAPSTAKNKGKRRSVPETAVKPSPNLIAATFAPQHQASSAPHRRTNGTTAAENITMNGHTTKHEHRATSKHEPRPTSVPPQESAARRDLADDADSGRLTSSSSSSSKKAALEELKEEVRQLVLESPDGLLCTDLFRLYRQRHRRELDFARFGLTCVVSLAREVPGVALAPRATVGDWLLYDAARAPPPAPAPARAPPRTPSRAQRRAARHDDSEDMLPGIDYAAEVFPEDCLHLLESIAPASVGEVRPGDALEVKVGEVYSPSHFWLQRLGDDYDIAMEGIMDEMNQYYTRGEGRERRLLPGAVQKGYHCACCYDGDWHRAMIVRIIDEDTVKVRYVDYGTVGRASASGLRYLRREWAALGAQALRARLAGVRPPAGGRLWPRTSAQHFLELVHNHQFIAKVVSIDAQDEALDVLLIDTSTSEDRCIATELVRAGHAAVCDDSATGTSESYLFPRFEALESGATPNFAEISTYIRDGIVLECVEGYRKYAMAGLRTVANAAPPPPPSLSPYSSPSPSPPASLSPPPSPSPPPHTASAASVRAPLVTPPAAFQRVPLVMPPAAYQCVPLVTSPAALEHATFAPPPAAHEHSEQGARLARALAAYEHAPLVTLTREQVHMYWRLSRLAPGAAQVFMLHTLAHALGPAADAADCAASAASLSRLDPRAADFRAYHTAQ